MISKNIKLFLVSSLVCCVANTTFTACSPDEFEGADPAGLPTAGGADFQMTVDQETNQMVATYTPSAGTYPVWIIDGASYSTLQEVGYTNTEAGTHTIELRIGNRNGISQAGVKKSFTFNETKVDWSADFRRITGKEWRIDNKSPQHFGCGPVGTAGTEWWSAGADEKKAFGIYDDRITFTAETNKGGNYSYNAGADGLTYVNKGTKWANGASEDVDVTLGNQDATWNFEAKDWTNADGEAISGQKYVHLAANTAFPYISTDSQYADPLFRVEQLTASKMVLIYDAPDGSIAWRYVFTSAAAEKPFEGFDANSDFNLWKKATIEMGYYYAPGWAQIADPVMKEDGGSYLFALPEATFDRWQCQIAFNTDIAVSAANNYDFSVVLNSSKDVRAMVKLTQRDDDGNFFFADEVDLKAGEDFVFWKSNMPGIDAPQMKLVLDFGGNEAGTDVEVRNIVLKDHANDDGTVLPNVTPGNDEPDDTATVNWVAVDSPENLGAGFNTKGEMNFWWADAGWSQVGNPSFSYSNGVYTVTAVANGGSEWQAQCSITDVPLNIEKGQGYDVRVKVVASDYLGRFTVKVNKDPDVTNDPNTLCYKGDFTLKEGENYLTFVNVVAKNGEEEIAFEQGKLIFDFGGAPEGFEAQISDIIIQKHVVDNTDPKNVDWCDYTSDENLGSGFNTRGEMGFWWADAGWSQTADPGFSFANGVYTITAAANGGSEWQAQCSITGVPLKIEKSQMYDVSVTIEASDDLGRCTVKVNKDPDITNDPNTLCYRGDFSLKEGENVLQFAGVVAKNNGEDIEFDQGKMIFDFGGAPEGFEAKISKIIVQKHKVK